MFAGIPAAVSEGVPAGMGRAACLSMPAITPYADALDCAVAIGNPRV